MVRSQGGRNASPCSARVVSACSSSPGWRPCATDFTVAAVVRESKLGELARDFGADEAHVVGDDDCAPDAGPSTWSSIRPAVPAGLERAIRLARREVHLKSTHGQEAAGLRFLDRAGRRRVGDRGAERAHGAQPCRVGCRRLRRAPRCCRSTKCRPVPQRTRRARLPRCPRGCLAPTARSPTACERSRPAIRPIAGREQPLVRPRGVIQLHESGDYAGSPLLHAIAMRGLKLSSSRCGRTSPSRWTCCRSLRCAVSVSVWSRTSSRPRTCPQAFLRGAFLASASRPSSTTSSVCAATGSGRGASGFPPCNAHERNLSPSRPARPPSARLRSGWRGLRTSSPTRSSNRRTRPASGSDCGPATPKRMDPSSGCSARMAAAATRRSGTFVTTSRWTNSRSCSWAPKGRWGVIARNLADYLWLLADGLGPAEAVGGFGAVTGSAPAAFRRFAEATAPQAKKEGRGRARAGAGRVPGLRGHDRSAVPLRQSGVRIATRSC